MGGFPLNQSPRTSSRPNSHHPGIQEEPTPFVAAVESTIEGKPLRVKFSRIANFRRILIKGWAVRHLRPAGPVGSCVFR